ncbi:hypothetical protein QYR00_17140 [Agrobacterium tumefaciens]|uniref:hypothetical protein n=1 Tax=Rhizobium/Agrobacterium group TaxID=227290 RepID=UPI00069AC1E4|nr:MULTISPECIES: hypothetical protein [Rhizobium/Agrobacterium group]WKL22245.1 hypothetical protein QYR00_17140 [Agrobacterium tumefaciens]
MQILPLGKPIEKLLAVNVEHDLSLLLAVEFAGFDPIHEILVDLRNQAAAHVVDHVHLGENCGNQAMHLQACRLVARCLADHHFLDELTHDRHQSALCILILALARQPHELPHRPLRLCWIMALAQFLDLGDHVRAAFRETGNILFKRLSFGFEPVERVIERR